MYPRPPNCSLLVPLTLSSATVVSSNRTTRFGISCRTALPNQRDTRSPNAQYLFAHEHTLLYAEARSTKEKKKESISLILTNTIRLISPTCVPLPISPLKVRKHISSALLSTQSQAHDMHLNVVFPMPLNCFSPLVTFYASHFSFTSPKMDMDVSRLLARSRLNFRFSALNTIHGSPPPSQSSWFDALHLLKRLNPTRNGLLEYP